MTAGWRITRKLRDAPPAARACLSDWGLRGTLERANPSYLRHRLGLWRAEVDDGFDREHGTETSAKVRTSRYGLPADVIADAVMYWATPARTFEEIHSTLALRHEDFVFIDLGSGKGRVVLLAAEHPYRKVIGVELSPELHRQAQANLDVRFPPSTARRRVEFHCARAETFILPEADLVLFLFNPFRLPVLETLLRRIEKSIEEHPRKLYLLYVDPYPAHVAATGRAGCLEMVAASPTQPPNDRGGRFAWYVFATPACIDNNGQQK